MCADVCTPVLMRADAFRGARTAEHVRVQSRDTRHAHRDSHARTQARTRTCLAQSSGTTALPSSLKRSPAQRSPPTDAPSREKRSEPAVRLHARRIRSCVCAAPTAPPQPAVRTRSAMRTWRVRVAALKEHAGGRALLPHGVICIVCRACCPVDRACLSVYTKAMIGDDRCGRCPAGLDRRADAAACTSPSA